MTYLKNIATLALLTLSMTLAYGSDATVVDYSEGGISPEPMETPMPSFRSDQINESSFVNVILHVNEEGYVIGANVKSSSDKSLESATLKSLKKWRFYPAYQDGERVACKIMQPIRFKSDMVLTHAVKKYSKEPKVASRVSPKLNDYQKTLSGDVMIRVNLDTEGQIVETFITHSSNDRLNQVSLQAIAKWRFRSAVVDGEAVACKVIVPFNYTGKKAKTETFVDRQASPLFSPNPRVSPTLKGLNGEVRIIATVDAGGFVAEAKVLDSSDDRFNKLALSTIQRWKYKPASLDGKSVQSQVVQQITFGDGNRVVSTRKKNDLLRSGGGMNPSLLDLGSDMAGLEIAQFEIEEDE